MKNKHSYIFLGSVVLFLVALPLVLKINFMQNDEWVFYKNVESLLVGNLTLHPWMAPTFYIQGFLSALFAKIFGLMKLPVLTLFVSVLNFYIFGLILYKFYKLKLPKVFLISLLFFFTPYNIYLSIGFLSGIYFLFFCLLTFYFHFNLESGEKKLKNYAGILLLIVLTFFVRQVALVLPLSLFLYKLVKKNYKESALYFVIFISLYVFLEFIFPQTYAMSFKTLIFSHFLSFDYVYAIIYGSTLVISSFLLPILIHFIVLNVRKCDKKQILMWLVLGIALFFTLNKIYNPEIISWGEYPYFENTFERTGFYPRGIDGTKYYFAGNYDLYKYWDLFSKIALSGFLGILLVNLVRQKKIEVIKINYFTVLFITYLGVMVPAETFYDRYNLLLIPVGTLALLGYVKEKEESKFLTYLLLPFVIFLVFFSYQLSNDFVHVNSYVWERSQGLVKEENVGPDEVYSSYAWRKYYNKTNKMHKYYFSYDSMEKNKELERFYELVETKDVEFPLNFFVNPTIYLYKNVR